MNFAEASGIRRLAYYFSMGRKGRTRKPNVPSTVVAFVLEVSTLNSKFSRVKRLHDTIGLYDHLTP